MGEESSAIIKQINPTTGKISTKPTEFNFHNWSAKTAQYILAINNTVDADTFQRLIEEATPYTVARSNAESKASTSQSEEPKRVLIHNDPVSDSEPEPEPEPVVFDDISDMEVDDLEYEVSSSHTHIIL